MFLSFMPHECYPGPYPARPRRFKNGHHHHLSVLLKMGRVGWVCGSNFLRTTFSHRHTHSTHTHTHTHTHTTHKHHHTLTQSHIHTHTHTHTHTPSHIHNITHIQTDKLHMISLRNYLIIISEIHPEPGITL